MKENTYRDVQASLMRFCRDFADEMVLEGYSLGFVNLDAHADENAWPEGDFIGMGEFNLNIEETDEIMVSFVIATDDDANLLKMSDLINRLVNQVLPLTQLKVYDADTGEVISSLFVQNGVRVGAPLRTKSQPLQPVMLRLLGDHQNF